MAEANEYETEWDDSRNNYRDRHQTHRRRVTLREDNVEVRLSRRLNTERDQRRHDRHIAREIDVSDHRGHHITRNMPANINKEPSYTSRHRMARRIQELFHDRFPEKEAKILLRLNRWDESKTIDFILGGQADQIRQALGNDGHNVLGVREDDVMRDIARKHSIATEVRQFGCAECDNMWWRRVPVRKMVSTCRLCKRRFEAIPREREYGWARFECRCGNEFNGYGQMGTASTKSRCYKCNTLCQPVRLQPQARRQDRTRRTNTPHSCTAPDCINQDVAVGAGGYGGRHGRHFNTQGGFNRRQGRHVTSITGNCVCVHPNSRKKRVLEASLLHVSTGSTVMTFLSQGSYAEYDPVLSDIDEGSDYDD